MSTGSTSDILTRLQSYLPRGWFGDLSLTPILNGLLTGIANTFSILYSLIMFIKANTRLGTSSGGWIDMWAADFFGNGMPRLPGETDALYIIRIQVMMLQGKATRAGMIAALTLLTGRAPVVTEFQQTTDTGSYSHLFGYGQAGAYGSMAYPWNCCIVVYRPLVATPQYGLLDSTIYTIINAVRPAGTVIWVRLSN